MRKLEKFKDWLTIEDAAKRLSISAGEDICEADILRLGLDGHLTLSVYFVNPVKGNLRDIERLGKDHFEYGGPQIHKTADEVKAWFDKALDELQESFDRLPAGWDQGLDLEAVVMAHDDGLQNPQRLEGVWDLPMLGEEALEVKREYQRLTGGVVVKQMCIGGPLVKKHNKPEVFEIFRWDSDYRHYCPASSLLDDGMLVVRAAVLHEFEGKMLCLEQSTEGIKPSYLLAITGLLELLLDDSRPRYTQGSAAEEIEARHPDWRGSSASNLTKLFAESKAAAKDADKEAQAKADARQASDSKGTARKAAKI